MEALEGEEGERERKKRGEKVTLFLRRGGYRRKASALCSSFLRESFYVSVGYESIRKFGNRYACFLFFIYSCLLGLGELKYNRNI